jgi:hypothetical protein
MLLSLRRRGQLLLATCVLLGVVVGAGCGMMVEDAQAPSALAALARERGASAAAASSSNRATAGSHDTASRSQAGDGPTVRRAKSLDRADRHDKAGKYGKQYHRGKGKPGKDK